MVCCAKMVGSLFLLGTFGFFGGVFGVSSPGDGKIVFCYWGTWSYYRPGVGKFDTTNIDPSLCTHIGYAFFGLSDDGSIKILDHWLDIDLGNIAKLVALKKKSPNLKVLASVGGWNEGSAKYSNMAGNAQKRAKFVTSAVNLLRQYGFNGLDLDWEYPGQRGGVAADRQNYITLLTELKNALRVYNYLLTVAVGAGESSASQSYNIPAVAQQVDFINLMTYDFGGSWDQVLSHNAPLEGSGKLNDKAAVEYWINQGAPANKLVLGIPLYGHTFTMANNAQHAPGSRSTGPGMAGPYTRQAGFLGYNEICTSRDWTHQWDAIAKVPYAYKGNQWVSYDNAQSILKKVEFIKAKNLAGAMVWSIETDDFRGTCGTAYPLLKAINQGLKSDNIFNLNNSKNLSCGASGFFRDLYDCKRFFICRAGIRYNFVCPVNLVYDEGIQACNFPELVECIF